MENKNNSSSNSYPEVPEEFKREEIRQGSSIPLSPDSNSESGNFPSEPKPQKSRKVLRKLVKFIIVLALFTGIGYGGLYLYNQNPQIAKFVGLKPQKPKFPALERPKEVTYQWEYQKQPYILKITVYGSVDDYYGSLPKGLEQGKEEESLNDYLNIPQEDKSISELTSSIKKLAAGKNLKSDQTLELAASFVQSIPYDAERARTDQFHPRYSYEVLYDKTGICSDKSILMIALLREMGYGNSAFLYDSEDHMAAGVTCPQSYSTASSGYCIIETTATGWRIGVIPEIKDNNQAIERTVIGGYNESGSIASNKKLTIPNVIAKMAGTEYKGIIETVKIENEISQLWNYFPGQKALIEKDQAELDSMKAQMDAYKSAGDIDSYNAMVAKYNSLLRKINREIDEYNIKVERYNKLILSY